MSMMQAMFGSAGAAPGLSYNENDRNASGISSSFVRYRWNITNVRDIGLDGYVQASDLILLSGGTRCTALLNANNVTGSSPPSEQPSNLYDNNFQTKWLNYNPSGQVELEFDGFIIANGFCFATGNDFPGRDPVQWTLQGSYDGVYWFNIHVQNTNAAVPTGRKTLSAAFNAIAPQAPVFVGTNGYLTFGGGSGAYSSLGNTNPALPKIMISSADNSCQRVYYGIEGSSPNRVFRIRYEGTASTSGSLGSPNMVWEASFYEDNTNTIDLQIGANARYPGGVKGVYTANNLMASLDPSPNSGWRIQTTGGGVASVTSIPSNLLGAASLANLTEPTIGGTDDGYWPMGIPWTTVFNGINYSL